MTGARKPNSNNPSGEGATHLTHLETSVAEAQRITHILEELGMPVSRVALKGNQVELITPADPQVIKQRLFEESMPVPGFRTPLMVPLSRDTGGRDLVISSEVDRTIGASIVDTLAHNPKLVAAISDANGVVSEAKLNRLVQELNNPVERAKELKALGLVDKDIQTLSSMSQNFQDFSGSNNGKIDLSVLTKSAFDGQQRWVDRLARDGNLPLDEVNTQKIAQLLPADADLRRQLSPNGDGSVISKDKVDLLYQDVTAHPEKYSSTPEVVAAVKQLHNSFNQFSTDGQTIDSSRLLNALAKSQLPPANPHEAAIVDTLAHNPKLMAYISDGQGNLSQDKIRTLYAQITGPNGTAEVFQSLNIKPNEFNTLKELNGNFSSFAGTADGKLNIDVMTRDAFGGNQRWVDRLARDGNLQLDAHNTQIIAQYLPQNPELARQLSASGDGTTISKNKVDQVYQDLMAHPEKYNNPEEVAAIKQLHNSFNQFSSDGKTIDPKTFGATISGESSSGVEKPAKSSAPVSKTEVTSVIDTLAYNRSLTAYISDGHGNISQEKVQNLLATLNGPDGAQLRQDLHIKQNEITTLNSLNDNFAGFKGSANGTLNIDTVARDAFAGDQRWVDRLARDGNLPIDDGNRQKIAQYLGTQDQQLRNQLSPDGLGQTISRGKVDQLYQDVINNPGKYSSQPETIAAVKQLHNSFNQFSTDGKTIDVGTISSGTQSKSGAGPISPDIRTGTSPTPGSRAFPSFIPDTHASLPVSSDIRTSAFPPSITQNSSADFVSRIVDTLATNRPLTSYISDGSGNVSQTKVQSLLADLNSPQGAQLKNDLGISQNDVATLNQLNDNFPGFKGSANGVLNLDTVARDALSTDPRLADSLANGGNLPIAGDSRQQLAQYLATQDQQLRNQLSPEGQGTTISRDKVNQLYQDVVNNPAKYSSQPETVAAVQQLHDSFNQLSPDGKTVDLRTIGSGAPVSTDRGSFRSPELSFASTNNSSLSARTDAGLTGKTNLGTRTDASSAVPSQLATAANTEPRALRGPGTPSPTEQSTSPRIVPANFARSSMARLSVDARADGQVSALPGTAKGLASAKAATGASVEQASARTKGGASSHQSDASLAKSKVTAFGADAALKGRGTNLLSDNALKSKTGSLVSLKTTDAAGLFAIKQAQLQGSRLMLRGGISAAIAEKISSKSIGRTFGDSWRSGKQGGHTGDNSLTVRIGTRGVSTGSRGDIVHGGKIKIGDRPGALFPGKDGSALGAAQWSKILRSLQNKDSSTCVPKRYLTGGEILAAAFIISAIAKRNDKSQNGGKGQISDQKGARDFRPIKLPPMFTGPDGKLVGSRPEGRISTGDARTGRGGIRSGEGRSEHSDNLIARGQSRRSEQTRCPEKRYFTGAELAILLATAGITRLRPDKNVKPAGQISENAPKLNATRLGDRLNSMLGNVKTTLSGGDATASGSFKVLANKQDSVKDEADNRGHRSGNDRRFFPGAEVAVSALMIFAGAARLRQQESQKNSFYPEERTVRVERTFKADTSKNRKPKRLAQSVAREIIRREDDPLDRIDLEKETEKEKETKEREARDLSVFPDAPKNERNIVVLRATHLIAPGETLVSIAEFIYHDGNVGWLIADLNLQNVKETKLDGKRIIEVQSRQRLELPTWQEISDFYRRRRPEFDPDNLITVVSENQIDRELVDAAFRPFLPGSGQSTQCPSETASILPPLQVNSMMMRDPGLDALPDLIIDIGEDNA